jgi:hypothetical protein
MPKFTPAPCYNPLRGLPADWKHERAAGCGPTTRHHFRFLAGCENASETTDLTPRAISRETKERNLAVLSAVGKRLPAPVDDGVAGIPWPLGGHAIHSSIGIELTQETTMSRRSIGALALLAVTNPGLLPVRTTMPQRIPPLSPPQRWDRQPANDR